MEVACLDTDALIEAYDVGITRFRGLRTNCISLYEFLRGLAYLGKSVPEYKSYVESALEVLALDNKSITTASALYTELRRKGTLVDDPDLLIASMCISNKIPIVTGNAKHFERFVPSGLVVRPLDEFIASVKDERGHGR